MELGEREIACRNCGYAGTADILQSNMLGTKKLERCPQCRSMNFASSKEPNMINLYNEDAIKWAKHYNGPKFHALLTDAPYHLTSITKRFGKDGVFARAGKGFMGTTWDGGDVAFRAATWKAFLSILMPGAFGMAFSAARNWHRMAVAIEDAGFLIHPTIFCWTYGSGFPKATRVKDERFDGHRYGAQAMKPAVEPIIVFQKPYDGRPMDNILESGAGTLNIYAGRVGTDEIPSNQWTDGAHPFGDGAGNDYETVTNQGRWPANFILGNPQAAQALDEQTGTLTSGKPTGVRHAQRKIYGPYNQGQPLTGYGDSGGASRFFYNVQIALDECDPVYYCAKASGAEREAGLEDGIVLPNAGKRTMSGGLDTRGRPETTILNGHPTVKPIDLARYLASLLLPPGEYAPRRILIPFSGVASECIGAHMAGWDEIAGIESDTENGYMDIAQKRIDYWTNKPVALDLFTGKPEQKRNHARSIASRR